MAEAERQGQRRLRAPFQPAQRPGGAEARPRGAGVCAGPLPCPGSAGQLGLACWEAGCHILGSYSNATFSYLNIH